MLNRIDDPTLNAITITPRHHCARSLVPWQLTAHLGSCTGGGLAATCHNLCSAFFFSRCLIIHAWHSPRLELWSRSPGCFLINTCDRIAATCAAIYIWFCFDLGAQQLEWKAAGCSPWCPPAFEVFVVVVCQSQPRGFDWHRFYVFSLCISDMCRYCAAQSACYLLKVGGQSTPSRLWSSSCSNATANGKVETD